MVGLRDNVALFTKSKIWSEYLQFPVPKRGGEFDKQSATALITPLPVYEATAPLRRCFAWIKGKCSDFSLDLV